MYDVSGQHSDLVNSTSATATSDSVFIDSGSVAHTAGLAVDGALGTWFGSSSQNNASWLQLDMGSYSPYYDELVNVTMCVSAC
jgi:hypothetical protein